MNDDIFVSDIVVRCICNICEMSLIDDRVHLSLCPKWYSFSSKVISTLSQCSVLYVGKDKLQKLKGHLIRVSFPY